MRSHSHSHSHSRSRSSLALALSLLTGCSIIHHASGDRPHDAGLDVSDAPLPDTNPPDDAGPDTNPDAWRCAHTKEVSCSNGVDDDCDGLIDCADPDCVLASDPACCTPGAATTTEHFDKLGGVWTSSSNWNAPASMVNAIDASNALSQMGSGTPPIGMVNLTCMHVDLGTEIRFKMRATPCTGTDCAGHMEVAIGTFLAFGGALDGDLTVRGTVDTMHGLRIDVLEGATVRASSVMPLGFSTADVVITLSPGVADAHPVIVGTVTVSNEMTMTAETIVTQIRVTDRSIFGTSGCHGLHLGVEGTGTHVALDDVAITQLDCANPGRFDALRDDALAIDGVTTSVSSADHTMGWGRGGIGDPALLEGAVGGVHRFFLMFDGSSVDRATDFIGHLPLSIGGADTSATSGPGNLVLVNDCSRWMPRGPGGSACTAPAMASGHDVIESSLVMRDPTIFPENGNPTTMTSLRVAWVGEDVVSGSPLRLYTSTLPLPLASRLGSVPTASTIEGEDLGSCPSIRNPLLLPIMGDTANWLLFYVCDRFPPVVHAATLHSGTGNATRFPTFEIGPAQLNHLADQGVTDIAGVMFVYNGVPTYRLWLTAHPTTASSSVLFLEGSPSAAGQPPMLVPFAGNPVLDERSPVFGSCGHGCQIHGITATRLSDQPTRVRLLIERWVDTGLGLQYGLIPLEQIWPAGM